MKKFNLMLLVLSFIAIALSPTMSIAQTPQQFSLPIPRVDKNHPYIKNNPQHPRSWKTNNRNVDSIGGQLYNIDFLNDNTGFVAGVYGIWKTTNGGNSWRESLVEDVVFNDSSTWYWIDELRIIDAQTMYAAGSKNTGPYGRAHIFITHDGGSNWSQTDIHDSMHAITNMVCRNQNDVQVSGAFGKMIKTTDGFKTWTLIDFMAASNYTTTCDMTVFNDKVFLSSFSDQDSVSFCISSPDLQQWQFSTDMNTRYPVFVPHSEKLIVAGSTREGDASISMSTDEGMSWQLYRFPFEGAIYCGVFFNENVGYIGGYEMLPGFITVARGFRTTDGGQTWVETVSYPYSIFTDICFTNSYVFYMGYGTVIFRTGNLTGVMNEPVNIPKVFQLKQNHPNPFNPSTKISFSLPKNSLVTLKVYNVAGKEVATIVEGMKNSGEHTLEFNGANLSSGVYFYRLTTNEYIETKKMLLVK